MNWDLTRLVAAVVGQLVSSWLAAASLALELANLALPLPPKSELVAPWRCLPAGLRLASPAIRRQAELAWPRQ